MEEGKEHAQQLARLPKAPKTAPLLHRLLIPKSYRTARLSGLREVRGGAAECLEADGTKGLC